MHNTAGLSWSSSLAPSSPPSRYERSIQVLFLLAVFCVPFSTWLTNVFIGFTLLLFVGGLALSPPLRAGLRAPPGLLAAALLALFAAGAAWSIGPAEDIADALRKYSRLLVLPIGLALNWRDPALARRVLRCMLAGLTLLAASSYLVWLQLMPTSNLGWWRIGDVHDAFAFKNHITLGILLGFACAASLLKASYVSRWRSRLVWLGGVAFFAVPVIFLNQGRTGYLVMMIGLMTVFLLRVRVTPLRVLAGLAGIGLLFSLFYATSDNMRARTDQLVVELQGGSQETANGLRMSYMQTGIDALTAHPLIGLGTGSFATAYAPTAWKVWPKGSPLDQKHQPHSEFLLVGVQLGLIGLGVYFTMLGTLLRPAIGVRSLASDCQVLLWIIYVSASSFNSLLWDTTEAYWFLLLSGSLYVASIRARELQSGRIQ